MPTDITDLVSSTMRRLSDVKITEAHRSQENFEGAQVMTAPLNAFLSLLHAIEWQDLKGKDNEGDIGLL